MKKYLILIISLFFLTSKSQTGLKGITWVLSNVEDKKAKTSISLNHDHSILRFEDSTYAGYGCNAYSGKYRITGNKINFLGGMQISDQSCTQPDDAKVEDYIMKDFIQLEYKQVGETLILTKPNEVVFTFNKKKTK
ncbi:MAG: META domain-containing protein [Bacteroidia bacterium]